MSNIHESIPRNKAKYFVNARQKTYLNSTEIYLPNNPYEKLLPSLEPSEKQTKSLNSQPITSEDDLKERALRRSFTSVKDIFMCNRFDLFVTFTFKADRQDQDRCRDKMMGWFKRQRKLDKNFQYVLVPELHKDGVSIHFHALITGYAGEIIRAINPKTNRPLVKGRRKVYDFPNYTLGHSEVYYIGDTEEDKIKSGFYLLKYLRKEMPNFSNKKRYWSSRGLKKPVTVDNPEEWYFGVLPDHFIDTQHGKFLFFNNDRIDIFLP